MKTHLAGIALFGLVVLTAFGQPPEQGKKGPGFDKKGPPPGFMPGKVLPPFVRDVLELSEEQDKQIAELEKEVRAKLMQILTPDQIKRLSELKDKGPKGPPKKDGKGFPEKGKKKRPDGPPKDEQTSVFDVRSFISFQPCPTKHDRSACRE